MDMTDMHLNEKKISGEKIFSGRVVELSVDKVELEDGTVTSREVITHPGGVCVVPINEQGEVYFVKQFRYPFGEVLLEIPAGKLEKGEDHKLCGIRELKEEVGCTAESFEYLGCLYPTVAYDTEVIHMYVAKELSFGNQNLDDGEFLDVIKIPFDKAIEMVMNNEIRDAKTQLALLKCSRG